MQITLDIPEKALLAALTEHYAAQAVPYAPLHAWIMDEPVVRCILLNNGFQCRWQWSQWYETDCVIAFNGEYVFPDGYVLKSYGTQLRFAGRR